MTCTEGPSDTETGFDQIESRRPVVTVESPKEKPRDILGQQLLEMQEQAKEQQARAVAENQALQQQL